MVKAIYVCMCPRCAEYMSEIYENDCDIPPPDSIRQSSSLEQSVSKCQICHMLETVAHRAEPERRLQLLHLPGLNLFESFRKLVGSMEHTVASRLLKITTAAHKSVDQRWSEMHYLFSEHCYHLFMAVVELLSWDFGKHFADVVWEKNPKSKYTDLMS